MTNTPTDSPTSTYKVEISFQEYVTNYAQLLVNASSPEHATKLIQDYFGQLENLKIEFLALNESDELPDFETDTIDEAQLDMGLSIVPPSTKLN